MNKLTYAKNYRKHPQVLKLKKHMLAAFIIVKDISYVYLHDELTGIKKLDDRTIKWHQISVYRTLLDRITEDINHEEAYPSGFLFDNKIAVLKYLKELNHALAIIEQYPEIPAKTYEYTFRQTDVREKRKEAAHFMQNNNIDGYLKQYHVLDRNGIETYIYKVETVIKPESEKIIVRYL